MFVSLRAMLPCSFVMKPFKVAISNDICKSVIMYANWLLHNFKQDGELEALRQPGIELGTLASKIEQMLLQPIPQG